MLPELKAKHKGAWNAYAKRWNPESFWRGWEQGRAADAS